MKIAIIGGGLTGLTTALFLTKTGFECTVYESAPQLNEIGAGIWLQPNAMQIMKYLGLQERIITSGCRLERIDIGRPDLTSVKDIKNKTVIDEFGNKTVAIHRGRLQQILYEEFSKVGSIELGMPYKNHEIAQDRILVEFETKRIEVNALLGADGIHSSVRDLLFPEAKLRDAGQVCWRGVSSFQLPADLQNLGRELWGDKIRFGFSQISNNQVYWFAVTRRKDFPKAMSVSQLADLFSGFDAVVSEIILHTNGIHRAELKDLKRLPSWHRSGVCLMGDAAHATTPNMGQGACQGMEDAYYLSFFLKNKPSVNDAFMAFESFRRKKVDYVVNNSWLFGKMVHHPLGQTIMKVILKSTPERIIKKQTQHLYEVKSPALTV
ncbi:MAG: FAD-dependent monooxygenase [Cyclobacteriaceae bacterium]|nr:FAD-dependent monooxygenase [Cyclobacteriaceae bacterium]